MAPAAKPIRLADLAADLGREVVGDGEILIKGVSPLESAGDEDLAYVRSGRWLKLADQSRAAALIVPEGCQLDDRPVIPSPNPALDFARVVERLVQPAPLQPGIHASAVVEESARVDPSVHIGAGSVVGSEACIGRGTRLHANVTLYAGVVVGEDCVLHAGVVLREHTRLGDRVSLQPGVVIGGDGFGYVLDEQMALAKVPQVGRVVLEDDVEIGANTTVDRASLAETRIRRGAKIDNLVQIGHNCDIGEDAVVIAQTGLSGSTVVERGAMIMAQAGSAGHLRVGERAFVGARAGLHKDVAPGSRVWGSPQLEERAWHRAMAALARLPDALRRLRNLERKLDLSVSKERSESKGPEPRDG